MKFQLSTLIKSFFFVITILAFTQISVSAQITFDNNGVGVGGPGAAPIVIPNFTVPAGNDRVLVIFTGLGSAEVASVTFDGTPATLISTVFNTAVNRRLNGYAHYVLLGSGAAVSGDIVMTRTGRSPSNLAAGSFHNVNQLTPIGSTATDFGPSGTTSTLSIPTALNNIAVSYCFQTTNFFPARGAGQTFLASARLRASSSEASYKTAVGTSTDMTYSSNVRLVHVGFELIAACDDPDGDGVCTPDDNCPAIANADQTDTDLDGAGDACDDDDDNDGCLDVDDANPLVASGDSDCDGIADDCDVCPGGDDNGPCDATSYPGSNNVPASWLCHNNGKKVYICHNGNTICVNENAVQAHLNHGDFLGPCTSCSSNRIDGSNIQFATSQAHEVELEVFPNPAMDEVNIRLHAIETAGDVMIFDVTGKLVFSQKVNAGDSEMNINVSDSRFSNGIYMVRMESEELSLMKRFVIQK